MLKIEESKIIPLDLKKEKPTKQVEIKLSKEELEVLDLLLLLIIDLHF